MEVNIKSQPEAIISVEILNAVKCFESSYIPDIRLIVALWGVIILVIETTVLDILNFYRQSGELRGISGHKSQTQSARNFRQFKEGLYHPGRQNACHF